MRFGSLEFVPANENENLTSEATARALLALPRAEEVGVAEIDPTLSDTAAFCARYQIGVEQAANCVILEAKRADRTWYAACVILASTRADVNGAARKFLDARRVSFAPMDAAVAESAMEYGAITPVGLPPAWPILVDRRVAEAQLVIIGSGIRKSKLLVPGSLIASLPNASIIDSLGR